ncbi:hypothetical protein [Nitrosomonas sp.]|uniref:hypothetical protein n=1 Tax=Nitrosomonas sp. TaxID=42353 RepID=UPI00374D63AA
MKTDTESPPLKLEGTILEQQIQAAEKTYGNWEVNLVQSMMTKHELPFCHVLENNHVAYVDYLRLYTKKRQQPNSGESIPSEWDKFCSIEFWATAGIEDLITNIKKACELYSPFNICSHRE